MFYIFDRKTSEIYQESLERKPNTTAIKRFIERIQLDYSVLNKEEKSNGK